MKPTHPWHSSPLGTAIRWFGGIQFAVPVLVFVAVAMSWGTYLESTISAKEAKQVVYGSWWFMLLMGLTCVSLVLAVITRFPWKRGHVGFIIVHASLVTLIFGGFWSMLGRVEGHLTLEEGNISGRLETEEESLELVEHDGGQFKTIAWIPAPQKPGEYTVGGVPVRVTERWQNCREEGEVVDGGPEPYRAVYLTPAPGAPQGIWVGDEARGGPARFMGLVVRVLADGSDWKAPDPAAAADAGYSFIVGDKTFALGAEGQEAFPGWKIASITRFKNATTTNNVVGESAEAGSNPAVTVLLTDGRGTTERHTAFKNFPDIYLAKVLEGSAASGARLTSASVGIPGAAPGATPGARPGEESLVIYGPVSAPRAAYVAADGKAIAFESTGAYPWTLDCGGRKITIVRQVARAREVAHITRAPDAKEHRPALVVSTGGGPGEPVAWKAMIAAAGAGRPAFLRFGPRTIELPFALRLDKFNKVDYPGTDMAMAYESDVTVFGAGGPGPQAKIHMNSPLARDGWKVYQSGFVGNTVSVFSVMKDPGLTATYIGSIGLCVGVLITFYSRKFSWGHPGIPAPFVHKENGNVSTAGNSSHAAAALAGSDGAAGRTALGGPAGGGRDPGRRAGDAAGHVREESGVAAHGA